MKRDDPSTTSEGLPAPGRSAPPLSPRLGILEASILKAIPHAVMGMKERVIVFANDAVQTVFGWRPEELVGKSTRILYGTDEEYEEVGRKVIDGLDRQGAYSGEIHCRRKDGTDITVRLTSATIGGDQTSVVAAYEDITDQVRTWRALRASEEKYRSMFENAIEGITRSSENELLEVNLALARMHGFDTAEEMVRVMRDVAHQLWVNPEERKRYLAALKQHGFVQGFESQVYRRDGTTFWTSLSTREVCDAEGNFLYYEGTVVNITDRKKAEEALRESERRFKDISYSMADWIWEVDERGIYTYCSERVQNVLGYSPDEVIGKRPADFHEREDGQRVKPIMAMIAREKRPIKDLEVWHVRKNGRRVCVLTNGVPVFDKEGALKGYRGVDKDVTDRKLLEERLQFLSFRDELTGLYNRRGFITLAQHQLKIAQRSKKAMLLIFGDVNGMKTINDTFGHQEGDLALKGIAFIMKETFRQVDIAGRIGGDEFAVLVIDGAAVTEETMRARLQHGIDNYNDTTPRGYELSLSIGMAHYDPETPPSLDDLMSRADALMYEEKRGR